MPHLLPCLITFNIVGYINERELNNWCGASSICNSWHIELHLICSVVCCTLPCLIKPDMHHTWLCIMTCLCGGCFTMLFVSFRVASLVSFGFVMELWGSVRLRPFVFFMESFFFLAGSQARWPYPQNHFYLCLLVVSSIVVPRCLPLAYHASQIAMSNL